MFADVFASLHVVYSKLESGPISLKLDDLSNGRASTIYFIIVCAYVGDDDSYYYYFFYF